MIFMTPELTASVPDNRPRVRAAVAAIVRSASAPPSSDGSSVADRYEILLTQRRAETVYGGYWELPGGKIETDETPEQAAVREVQEEVGCDVISIAMLSPITFDYDHAHVTLHCVQCRLAPGSPEPRNLEVAAHAWTRLSEMPWESFLPANVRLITALCRALEHEA